ncbi:hypothetical protein EDM57_04500 [Brevibacillus gelatini]|uniref:Uncharacterized protein n=1 Tax=Brevibacillus gelatini TaxID=1655277 RepID=A0A3M8B8V2_9BACL|nr:hypothetical protein [Brevibacillus gelatini]RNB59407.1 hypothetical protein EDM57_04500 [Brevibacillus gelatini]
MDRLKKIKDRLSETGKGYDLTKDVETTELFSDVDWLIESLESAIKARDIHYYENEKLQNRLNHVHGLAIRYSYKLIE